MGRLIDLQGLQFGRWTVLTKGAPVAHGKPARWLCQCACGETREISSSGLRNQTSRSCGSRGCTPTPYTERARKHGGTANGDVTFEYRVWAGLKTRCYNAKRKEYANYGGRGITVCDEWRNSFVQFVTDMGLAPSEKHSIERVDNDGNYCKENCYWATSLEQAHNKRNNRKATINGVSKTLPEWAREYGFKVHTLYKRRRLGWQDADLLQPLQEQPS